MKKPKFRVKIKHFYISVFMGATGCYVISLSPYTYPVTMLDGEFFKFADTNLIKNIKDIIQEAECDN